jgi:hypothetical protein
MLGPFVQFVVGAHIVMAASGGPPRVDIDATCRASEKDLIAMFGSAVQATIEACVKQENDALEQIKKNWATYPADAKTLCVQPGVYSPSYVEWLTCFEMDLDVRKIRAENAKAAKANASPPRRRSPTSRVGSETKQCPVVQFRPDGSIASVINC